MTSPAPVEPVGSDDALWPLLAFARALRAAGMPVGSGAAQLFCVACARLGPGDIADVYWAGRACLVDRAGDLPTYDAVFRRCFGADASVRPVTVALQALTERAVEVATRQRSPDPPDEPAGEAMVVGAGASPQEALRHRRFDRLSAGERVAVEALISQVRLTAPTRRSRRTAPDARGRRADLRRSLRQALRTDGEIVRPVRRARQHRPRRLVFLLDVSRSMASSTRALLLLAHAAMRSGAPTEVYCFGTRLTRVSPALDRRDPQQALAAAAEQVVDWDGGTRIGASLQTFRRTGGRAGLARGAVMVICSDGLERGDPTVLGAEMARLSRLAYRVVWVNPLRADPRYEPRARGMAAALPHLDHFVPGHDLASLEVLAGLLSSLVARGPGAPAPRPIPS